MDAVDYPGIPINSAFVICGTRIVLVPKQNPPLAEAEVKRRYCKGTNTFKVEDREFIMDKDMNGLFVIKELAPKK